MANTQDLINALVSKGYSKIDAQNAARGSNATNLAKEYLGTGVTSDLTKSTVPQGAVSSSSISPPPAGGYKTGGWYGSRQAWQDANGNWTFSEPGQINKLSNQQGAGQMVSPEILASTSVAAGKDPNANQQYINSQYQQPAGGEAGMGAGGMGTGGVDTSLLGGAGAGGLGTNKPIDLNAQYAQLLTESGVSNLETNANALSTKINQMTAEAADAKAKVNENPFLAEASRIGRIAKIDQKLNESIAPLQKDISNITGQINTAKNDIQNKLNLNVQQYNIETAANQQNLANFNSLLASGALVNATAQDIATLASQTGLAPSFIASAIAQAKKSASPISTGTFTDSDGNLTAYTLDSSGNLLNSQVIGNTGKATTSSSGSKTSSSKEKAINSKSIIMDAQNGASLRDIWKAYEPAGFTASEVLSLYNKSPLNGKATETVQDILADRFYDLQNGG